MKQSTRWRCAVLAMVATSIGGCTMKKQEAPDLAGPSEFGTSVSIALSPEVLQQDGVSQSTITVTTRGQNGAPVGMQLRVEVRVNGALADFGILSKRMLTTGSNGEDWLTYTAPPPPPIPVPPTEVQIAITPVGPDASGSATRVATLRLVSPSGVVPPNTLQASFAFTPSAPTDNQTILFDASDSQGLNSGSTITSYAWDFGDGHQGAGRTVSHAYRLPGSYAVRLTIADAVGRTGSASRTVSVSGGTNPTAQFIYSPGEPIPGQAVHFDASLSRAAPGQRITSYRWVFGDGSEGHGAQASHAFARAGTYNVSLTVTDDAGRTASTSQSVTVAVGADPTADFTFSPTVPFVHQNVHFNGIQSTAADGRQIVSYLWDFGAGGAPAQGVQVTRAFGAPGTYTVTLTVTDSDGRIASVAREVTVAP